MKPFTVNILASGPTLAMGISFFLWIPLSVGFGRRLNIIMSAMLLTCATIGAGFAAGFHGLLAALCLIGFATGAVLSTVSTIWEPHLHTLASRSPLTAVSGLPPDHRPVIHSRASSRSRRLLELGHVFMPCSSCQHSAVFRSWCKLANNIQSLHSPCGDIDRSHFPVRP